MTGKADSRLPNHHLLREEVTIAAELSYNSVHLVGARNELAKVMNATLVDLELELRLRHRHRWQAVFLRHCLEVLNCQLTKLIECVDDFLVHMLWQSRQHQVGRLRLELQQHIYIEVDGVHVSLARCRDAFLRLERRGLDGSIRTSVEDRLLLPSWRIIARLTGHLLLILRRGLRQQHGRIIAIL